MAVIGALKDIYDADGELIAQVINVIPVLGDVPAFIRLQFYPGIGCSYRWNDDTANYNDTISDDPSIETRWELEV